MARTELFSRKQSGGVFTITNTRMTTGEIFFVDDSGTDAATNGKNPDNPIATIDYAIGLCTAGAGDMIFVMPGHAETVTSAITCDVAGVSIIGLGEGNLRPTVTGNGTIDAVTVTSADVRIENIEFAVPGTDAQTADINVVGTNCVIRGTIHHGSTTAKNKVAIITVTATAFDLLIEDVTIYNKTVEVVGGIVFEGAAERVTCRNVIVHDAIGFTNGSINDAATALQLTLDNCVFANAKADTVVAEFGNNTTGIARNCYWNGRNTTIQSNVTTGTGMNFFECYGVEEAAKNGLLMPVADTE